MPIKAEYQMKIGEKKNSLTLIERNIKFVHYSSGGRWLSKFLCDCGNAWIGREKTVLSENNKRCGKGHVLTKDRSVEEIKVVDFFLIYKRGAINRGLCWELTLVEVDALINGDCFYCDSPPELRIIRGERLKQGRLVMKAHINGIDRMDNSMGYTKENCVSCCKTCNRAKHTMSVEAFLEKATKIHNKHYVNKKPITLVA